MLGVRLDPLLEARVARAARARGITKSALVRDAISEFVNRHDPEDAWLKERQLIAAHDGAAGERDLDALSDLGLGDLPDDDVAWDAPVRP